MGTETQLDNSKTNAPQQISPGGSQEQLDGDVKPLEQPASLLLQRLLFIQPPMLTPATVLTLQRTAGNRAVQRMLTQTVQSQSKASAISRSGSWNLEVQRYDSYEHAKAGDSAAGSQIINIQGIDLTTGEINALADLYGSPTAIMTANPAELKKVVELIRKQVANPASVTEADWDQATGGRYNQLNLKNSKHFGPQNKDLIAPQPSTPAGTDNQSTWIEYHKNALAEARLAATTNDRDQKKNFMDEARVVNAFGEHFLVDAFSAGHLFNKADTVATIQKNLGALKKAEMGVLFKSVAAKVWAKHSKLISTYEADIPGPWWPNLNTQDRFQSLLEGMYEQEEGKQAFYSAIIKAVHDRLNTQKDGAGNIGVPVRNDFEEWFLSGDRTLASSPQTQKWLGKALEQSRNNLETAFLPATTLPDEELIKKVLVYVPKPTPDSAKAIHDLLQTVTDPKGGMDEAIAGVLNSEIQSILDILTVKGYIRKA